MMNVSCLVAAVVRLPLSRRSHDCRSSYSEMTLSKSRAQGYPSVTPAHKKLRESKVANVRRFVQNDNRSNRR